MAEIKRPCKICGQVHLHMPFTDCYGGKEEDLPDSLQDHFKMEFGSDEVEDELHAEYEWREECE